MFDLCIDQYIFDKPDNRAMLMMMTFIVIRVVMMKNGITELQMFR